MVYTPSDWQPGEAGGTPITAEALLKIENGIADVSEQVEGRLSDESLNGTFLPQEGGANISGPFTSLLDTETAEGFIIKPTGDGRQGIIGWQHSDTAGYILHLESRSGGAAPAAMIGIGLDFAGAGPSEGVGGILIANKAWAKGITIGQEPTITNANAFGIWLRQRSIAPALRGQIASTDASTAPLVVLAVEGGVTADAAVKLQEWRSNGNFLAGDVNANTGLFRWIGGASFRDTQIARTLTLLNDTGTGNPAQITLTDTAGSPIIMELSANADNKSNGSMRFYRATGGGTYWASRVVASGQDMLLQTASAAAKGSESWGTIIGMRASALGFFGTTPISKRAATADATDLATALTLVNALKADLVAYGLKTA